MTDTKHLWWWVCDQLQGRAPATPCSLHKPTNQVTNQRAHESATPNPDPRHRGVCICLACLWVWTETALVTQSSQKQWSRLHLAPQGDQRGIVIPAPWLSSPNCDSYSTSRSVLRAATGDRLMTQSLRVLKNHKRTSQQIKNATH